MPKVGMNFSDICAFEVPKPQILVYLFIHSFLINIDG